MTTPMPRPGRSKQDYQTPRELLDAVRRRLGIVDFSIDLAASVENRVCPRYYSEEDDSFLQPWNHSGWQWLNPEFGWIEPWVMKAWVQTRQKFFVAVLVPASTGANWWADYVHNKARVLFLNGRITFVGQTDAYPKDCVILLYGPDIEPGYEVWRWKGTR